MEIRHGEWIETNLFRNNERVLKCSVCGEETPQESFYNPNWAYNVYYTKNIKTNYCPNCGSKMYIED